MPGWKRKRRAVPTGDLARSRSDEADQIRSADRLAGPVLDLTAVGGAERYAAWVDRMRDKRHRDQAAILGPPDAPTWDHWSAESVLGTGDEDQPLDAGGQLGTWETARALEVLGLDARAGAAEVAVAFRALAKVHHPDRWAEADDAVQCHHAEQMLRVNAAYRALRSAASVA